MQVDERQLGDFLLDARLLSRGQLDDARERAQDSSLYDTLVHTAAVPEDDLRRAAAHVLGIPFVILQHDDISEDALMLVPEPLARKHSLAAFRTGENTIEVILLDLDDLEALQFLHDEHHYKILPRLTDRSSLKRALLLYQKVLKEKFGSLLQHGEAAVDALIHHALMSRAGGVHLDLSTTGMLVRHRIGHVLHEAMQLPLHVGTALSDRLKTLAKLLPTSAGLQEGRFKIEKDGERHTVHVSAMQTDGGEKLMLRLARDSHGQSGFSLESLGLHGEALEHVHEALGNRSGLILVSGPQDAGKTTALYTLLDILASPHLSIATVEDIVEHRIPHVSQMQVRKDAGVSFASTVRSALKQDVDVLMLGNIEDSEVAMLAVNAASRGVIVLAAIEAGSTAETIQKMSSFDVSSLILGSTLKLVINSRVVRKLCPKYQEEHRLSRVEGAPLEDRANFGRVLATLKDEKVVPADRQWKDMTFMTAESCKDCDGGYNGLVGLQEVLAVSAPIKELILRGEEVGVIEEHARQAGMLTLLEDGLFKAGAGLTSIEELLALVDEPN